MGFSNELAERIRAIVGHESLLLSESRLDRYRVNTLDSPRSVVAAIQPRTQEEAAQVVQVLGQAKVPFYPLSTGRNWGYGGATPVSEGCVILDLSRLRRIIEFNPELGYVVVEPGVTQQDLYEFLKAAGGRKFMVPTTGAGPSASILGNAIERGYGITPHEDHFGSLLSLKAVLADGSIYQSALHELGGRFSDQVFKWKVGPYLDGLFAQSSLGVVLEGTFSLAPTPESVTQFIVFVNDEEFETAVQTVREIKQSLGGITGGVNLMNKRRLLSMVESQWAHERALEEIRVIELARKRDLPDWALVGAFYGPRELVHAGTRWLRRTCRGFSNRTILMDRKRFNLAQAALKYVPLQKLRLAVDNAGKALEILEGRPSQVALPLAYLKNSRKPEGTEMNPDLDRSGLIWFAPLVPMDPPVVRDYVQEVTKICLYHDMDPLLTLTSISDKCFDSTVPLLYNKDVPGEAQKAKRCFEDLLSACREMELFPYRLDIDHMGLLASRDVCAFEIARKIKDALDPNHVIAPGRYIR